MGDTALKLAMIFQASMGDTDSISALALGYACNLTTWLMARLSAFLKFDLAFGEVDKNVTKVINKIKEAGASGIRRDKLMREMHLLKKDLDLIVDTLLEQQVIYKSEGKPVIYYYVAKDQ